MVVSFCVRVGGRGVYGRAKAAGLQHHHRTPHKSFIRGKLLNLATVERPHNAPAILPSQSKKVVNSLIVYDDLHHKRFIFCKIIFRHTGLFY